MNRTGKRARVLALAITGVVSAAWSTSAIAGTDTWNSTGSQDWFSAGNWTGGVPGSGDTGLFSTKVPPSNTVLFSNDASIGAILDSYTPSNAKGATNTFTIDTTGNTQTLTLFGQTVTVPEAGQTSNQYTQANTILSNTTQLTLVKTLTLTSNINLVLNGTASYILGSQGSGANAGQNININGNIADGVNGPSQLIFLGGGTSSASGATLNLNGSNNTFSGGLVIGAPPTTNGFGVVTADANQGGAVSVTSPTNLPATGNIVVNEQGQLLLSGAGVYGALHQMLYLNGIGENKNSSGALRNAGGATDTNTWQGDVTIGTAEPSDATSNFVVLSSTGSREIVFSGKVTGTGSLQKQGGGLLDYSGTNNDNSGAIQIGNGSIQVENGSQMGTGDLIMFQTASNTTTVNLLNTNQNVGNLISAFTAVSGGSPTKDIQAINLLGPGNNLMGAAGTGGSLTVHQTNSTTFGYGADSTLTSTIQGPGSLIMNAGSTGTLSLTGPNAYTGGTIINGGVLNIANGATGSATGTASVTVNSGGTLASGGNITVFSGVNAVVRTSGTITGPLIVNSGGVVAPGGIGKLGTLIIGTGGINANAGANFNFDLIGGTNAQTDTLNSGGTVTLDNSGTENINIAGSKLAFGNYTLMNYPSITNGTQFVLGSHPAGNLRTYSLVLSNTSTIPGDSSLILNIIDNANERSYSVGGGSTIVDGAGTWAPLSTNFYNSNPSMTQAPYSNTATDDVVVGNGGAGGVITLTGNVIANGPLVLNAVTTPYTIGAAAGTNTLTIGAGIFGSANATINAPLILSGAQTITSGSGNTITINSNISEIGGPGQLIKDDFGTLVLAGTNGYTGGTIISNGFLQATTASLPATGGVVNNASLIFAQGINGTYAGLISGSGSVTVSNTASAAIELSNTSNSYAGATVLLAGKLRVDDPAQIGNGVGGISLNGGTLQFGAPVSLGPTLVRSGITLAAGTTSTVDTNGQNVTINNNLTGPGNFTKAGIGNLTLTGLPSTTVLGTVAITAGTLTLAPPSNVPSYAFSGTTATNTYVGDLTIAQPLELRLQGGNYSGGGHINVQPSGILIVSRGTTVIGNNLIIDANASPIPGFVQDIGANASNSIKFTAPISGAGDVDFTGGAGNVILASNSSYSGTGGNAPLTTIDNSAGGEIQAIVNNALPTNTTLHITSTGILDLFGVNMQVGSLDSTSINAQVINEAGTTSVTGGVTTFHTVAASISIIGTASTVYNGVLEDGQISPLGMTLGATNTGALALTNTNLNSGPLNIIAGRLEIDNLSALGAPSLITVGATAGNSQLRFNGQVGAPTYQTTLLLSANPSPISLAGLGGYTDGGGFEAGAIRVDNGSSVTLNNSITFTVDSSVAADVGSTLTLTGNFSGPGALVSSGGGQVFVSGTTSGYTGGTQVNNGVMTVTTGSSLGQGPLQVNNQNTGAGNDVALYLSNASQTVGSLSGTIATPSSGTNTATIYLNPANLTVNQTTNGSYAGVIAGSGSFTVAGTATLALTGSNTYAGATTLNGGSLNFKGLANLGSSNVLNFGGGALQYASGNNVDISTMVVSLLAGGGTIDTNGNNVSFNHSIGQGGVGGLTKIGAGSLTLNSVNNFSGPTTVNGGTLNLNAAGVIPGGNVTDNANLLVSANSTLGTIGGTGTTTVAASRTLNVSSITQAGLVNQGTTQVTGTGGVVGTISGNGTLNIGAAGSLSLGSGTPSSTQGALSIATGGLLNVASNALTLNYTTNPSPNSTIRNYISSAYNVNGSLWTGTTGITSSVAKANPGHSSIGFADGADGVVTNLPAGESPAIPAGGVLPTGNELIASVFPGDGNMDGKVDFNDFVLISTHFLASDINWDHGNFNYDGVVDFNDFVVLSTNFGEGVTGGDGTGATAAELAQFNALATSYGISKAQIAAWDATISTLPEPTSAGLLAVGAVGLLQRRRRRQNSK